MDIVKTIWDANLTDDQAFLAAIIREEFSCGSCTEKIKNKTYINQYLKPLNDFNIYTTAQPNAEGIKALRCRK